jgi:hypothetical protein
MKLWACFICGADSECAHREVELMVWFRSVNQEQQEIERRRALNELRIEPKSATVGMPMKIAV